jgi:ABC-type branched-subunit amino acid transport system substrate-binding protein
VPAEQVEGLYSCLDYYRDAEVPFSRELLDRYNTRYPGGAMFTGGGACSGMYRGMRLWEAAVREAGSLHQSDVIEALDHATIPVGPGGPAEMVPGQHHVRMNMYIGQVQGGEVRTIKRLGVIDPDEQAVPSAPLARV